MINEQRVSLMTRMEIYRKHNGRRDERISAYFMGDYLAKQVLLSVICASAAFLLCIQLFSVRSGRQDRDCLRALSGRIYRGDRHCLYRPLQKNTPAPRALL